MTAQFLQAEGDGGAIVITNSQAINVLDPAQAYRATTSISGTTFINNTAQNGGGISITNAGLLVSNSLFEYCFATQAGAGRGGAVVGASHVVKALKIHALACNNVITRCQTPPSVLACTQSRHWLTSKEGALIHHLHTAIVQSSA